MTPPRDVSAETLASIEAVLICDGVSVREALRAAYQLGRLDGMLEMAKISESSLKQIFEKEPS
jgi:hypothetical protein